MEVQGELHAKEVRALGQFASRRLLGQFAILFRWFWPALGAAGYAISWLAGDSAPYVWIAAIVTVWIGYLAWTQLAYGIAENRWKKRGEANRYAVTYRVEDEALVFRAPSATYHLAWTGISEISLNQGYWVIFCARLVYALPRRFFAGPEDEQAFMQTCRNRLSAEARQRSVGEVKG